MSERKAKKTASTPARKGEGRGGVKAALPPHGRTATGRFAKGFSGNPGGAKPLNPELREVCRREDEPNVERLKYLRDHSKDPWVAIECIKLLLAYAHGKPNQLVTATGPLVSVTVGNGQPITDLATATRTYADIMGNPAADLSGIVFALPAPAPREAIDVKPDPRVEPVVSDAPAAFAALAGPEGGK